MVSAPIPRPIKTQRGPSVTFNKVFSISQGVLEVVNGKRFVWSVVRLGVRVGYTTPGGGQPKPLTRSEVRGRTYICDLVPR